jgi:hypothetical protein
MPDLIRHPVMRCPEKGMDSGSSPECRRAHLNLFKQNPEKMAFGCLFNATKPHQQFKAAAPILQYSNTPERCERDYKAVSRENPG